LLFQFKKKAQTFCNSNVSCGKDKLCVKGTCIQKPIGYCKYNKHCRSKYGEKWICYYSKKNNKHGLCDMIDKRFADNEGREYPVTKNTTTTTHTVDPGVVKISQKKKKKPLQQRATQTL